MLGTVGCHGFGLVGTIMASGRPDITHNHYAIIIHLLSMLVGGGGNLTKMENF